jgi:hypothetical protein
MSQITHKREPAHTKLSEAAAETKPKFVTLFEILLQALFQFLSSDPEDCEPSLDPEDFGRVGVGVGVEVESEYDLELRIGGNVGRPGVRHSSLLTVPKKTVRW